MDSLMNFLMFALPGGFIGSIFAWLFGRRKRDNDMLSQLQASINLLSEENRKILSENVQLRRENADLKANQEEMILKLTGLTKEVERLRKVISKQTVNNEKQNTGGHPHTNSIYDRALSDRVQHGETEPKPADLPVERNTEVRKYNRSHRAAVRGTSTEDGRTLAGPEEHRSDTGSDSVPGGDGEHTDTEPP
ncbi:hypothetical protein [Bacteroides cellulosilyticus]|jgi:hypothetical protein|uniref:hypothetical protein n=1 Tax=Bacteroides cellulosilyticus TaxID=246787 RepID=UPI00101DC810|nr:hypothetical protein [Bacteroides cellulosilyticus]